jgi:hypothetical protein
MNAFLEAEARIERERLLATLTVVSIGAQGDKATIERLHRQLNAD